MQYKITFKNGKDQFVYSREEMEQVEFESGLQIYSIDEVEESNEAENNNELEITIIRDGQVAPYSSEDFRSSLYNIIAVDNFYYSDYNETLTYITFAPLGTSIYPCSDCGAVVNNNYCVNCGVEEKTEEQLKEEFKQFFNLRLV
jgi:hypothetical protein